MTNPHSPEIYINRSIPKDSSIRGDFFRDQTAIIHSMPFRRLKHKTQVFFSPNNDHVCTRIEHVLHVATIGSTICKGLNNNGWGLNIEMAYAIGLGHDLGHSPFGHAGETALNKKLNADYKFIHEVHGLRVVDKLCNNGTGLNLTYGVRDGIINHNGEVIQQSLKPSQTINNLEIIKDRKSFPCSYEGCIVRISDKIAYLGRDIEDALIANFISIEDIPSEIREEVGETNGEIINNLVIDVIETSKTIDEIKLSDRMFEKVNILQKFNYKHIYGHPIILEYKQKGEKILEEIFDFLLDLHSEHGKDFDYYLKNPLTLIQHFGNYFQRYENVYESEGMVPKRLICDFIAGMTDGYALDAYNQIKIPRPIKFK
ncbi:MAG: HD domain-containing protein [Bacteroidales bacterium]|nr:HD domain-containing protein [Bacteroidales bacterium]